MCTIERVLWDPSIRHAVNISQPAESALGVEVLDSALGEDLGVGHAVRPLDAEDVPQISQMECVQSLFLSGVRSPRLAAIEEGAEDAFYTATLIWMVSLPFSPDSFEQTGKGRGCKPDVPVGLGIQRRSCDTDWPRYVNSFTTSSLLLLTVISGV